LSEMIGDLPSYPLQPLCYRRPMAMIAPRGSSPFFQLFGNLGISLNEEAES
jgi:hypothetical protein